MPTLGMTQQRSVLAVTVSSLNRSSSKLSSPLFVQPEVVQLNEEEIVQGALVLRRVHVHLVAPGCSRGVTIAVPLTTRANTAKGTLHGAHGTAARSRRIIRAATNDSTHTRHGEQQKAQQRLSSRRRIPAQRPLQVVIQHPNMDPKRSASSMATAHEARSPRRTTRTRRLQHWHPNCRASPQPWPCRT